MELKDIGTKELRELNLYPLNQFNIFKQCFEKGYFIIPTKPYRGYGQPNLRDICHASKNERDGEKIKLNNFLETTKEEMERFGFSGKSLFKLLWLQKYLRGEVEGCYDVTEDDSFQSFRELEELEKKDKTIQRLNRELQEEKCKNKELQEKIHLLENEIKKSNKLRYKLSKFVEENKKFLEDYSSELN